MSYAAEEPIKRKRRRRRGHRVCLVPGWMYTKADQLVARCRRPIGKSGERTVTARPGKEVVPGYAGAGGDRRRKETDNARNARWCISRESRDHRAISLGRTPNDLNRNLWARTVPRTAKQLDDPEPNADN